MPTARNCCARAAQQSALLAKGLWWAAKWEELRSRIWNQQARNLDVKRRDDCAQQQVSRRRNRDSSGAGEVEFQQVGVELLCLLVRTMKDTDDDAESSLRWLCDQTEVGVCHLYHSKTIEKRR